MAQTDKIQKAFNEISEGVKSVYSSANYQNYLKFMAKFHDYSINNTMLILMQRPDASFVAGYTAWKNRFHRQVRKGEKAIKILAPYQIEIEHEDDHQTEQITKFRMVNVFDISQTTGEPIPQFINDLEGTSYNCNALRAALVEISEIPIIFSNPEMDEEMGKGVKGYFNKLKQVIVINEELEDVHIAKTLIYEYAHSVIHAKTNKPLEQKEIEAESIAYVVCNHFGIDTSEYSFGYIASYANREIEEIKHILDNIQLFANELIKKIEPVYQKHLFLINYHHGYLSPLSYERFALPLVKRTYLDYAAQFEGMLNQSESENRALIDKLLCKEMEKEDLKHHQELYLHHPYYKRNLIEWLYLRIATNLKFEELHPIILNSLEHQNYLRIKSLAEPILDGRATYLKYRSKVLMDLNIEIINDNEIAISHYYEQNGDMMADPDVTLKFDNQNEIIYATSYSQDNLSYYINIEHEAKLMNDVNSFMEEWLDNIENGDYELEEIHTEEEIIHFHKEKTEFIDFMHKNEMKAFYKNLKEKGFVKIG